MAQTLAVLALNIRTIPARRSSVRMFSRKFFGID